MPDLGALTSGGPGAFSAATLQTSMPHGSDLHKESSERETPKVSFATAAVDGPAPAPVPPLAWEPTSACPPSLVVGPIESTSDDRCSSPGSEVSRDSDGTEDASEGFGCIHTPPGSPPLKATKVIRAVSPRSEGAGSQSVGAAFFAKKGANSIAHSMAAVSKQISWGEVKACKTNSMQSEDTGGISSQPSDAGPRPRASWKHVQNGAPLPDAFLSNGRYGDTCSKSRCCSCFSFRRAPPAFRQTLVLLRHSERQDYMEPTYHDSDEGKAWPHDCPITKNGITLARQVSKEIAEIHKEAPFSAIITSPYRRCLMTAREVAKKLKLPVMIDQEMGEVWDDKMPHDPTPWRSPLQLKELTKSMKLSVVNPLEDNGDIKCFGRKPKWPESLEQAKKRYCSRIETYIERSAESLQNFVLVTHADALAAALAMFERGGADIQGMDFCARVIARRTVEASRGDPTDSEAASAYAQQWDVDFKGMKVELMPANGMEKIFEKVHLDNCEEQQQVSFQRKKTRTRTDHMFDAQIKKLQMQDEEIEKAIIARGRTSWTLSRGEEEASALTSRSAGSDGAGSANPGNPGNPGSPAHSQGGSPKTAWMEGSVPHVPAHSN